MDDHVDCPTCGDSVPVGLPRDATVRRVVADADADTETDTHAETDTHTDADADTNGDTDGPADDPAVRNATPACPTCGVFLVVFEVSGSDERYPRGRR
jgi:ribosomal protein S27AE